MSTTPSDVRIADSHEWHRVDGDIVTLGISQFAANELTDVTYVEMQEPGTELGAGEAAGELESVKATSDVYTGVSGVVTEINEALAEDPGLVNRDPFGEGWLCRIKVSDTSTLDALMDASTYDGKYPL